LLKQSIDKVYLNSGNQDVLKLVTKPGSIILDAGCGGGVLAKILSSIGHVVDGVTISADELAIAKPFVRNVYLHNLEAGLPLELAPNQYDCVICSHVLEHIVYPEKLLADIYKVLKPGGLLIVALPNIMHYKSRMKLMSGNFDYQDAGIWDYTHVKWYTFKSAKQLLLNAGFTVELATVTGELPLNSLFSKILPASLCTGLFNLLTKVSKGFFGYQLLFTARKAEDR
jgi:2-polyprenyl-3-methyl-5-hydroxy-6-metoxy-1,4-benzoquinol methylase